MGGGGGGGLCRREAPLRSAWSGPGHHRQRQRGRRAEGGRAYSPPQDPIRSGEGAGAARGVLARPGGAQ